MSLRLECLRDGEQPARGTGTRLAAEQVDKGGRQPANLIGELRHERGSDRPATRHEARRTCPRGIVSKRTSVSVVAPSKCSGGRSPSSAVSSSRSPRPRTSTTARSPSRLTDRTSIAPLQHDVHRIDRITYLEHDVSRVADDLAPRGAEFRNVVQAHRCQSRRSQAVRVDDIDRAATDLDDAVVGERRRESDSR